MDRTDDFFQIIGESTGLGSASRVLKKGFSNYFNEASYNIANLILSIGRAIEDNHDSFVDRFGAILSRKSSMSEEERDVFVSETISSISSAEQLISELAANVNSGRMGLSGNAIDHSIGVFACLDRMLGQVKRNFAIMRAQRENVKIQSKYGMSLTRDAVKVAPTRTTPAKPDIDESYQNELSLEHQSVMDELLEFHDQLVKAESLAEEIATMQRIFNDMMAEQTEKIRVIRSEVEEAAVNYEVGTKEVDRAAKRTKWQHLWISIVIYCIALLLLFKQLREDLKRM